MRLIQTSWSPGLSIPVIFGYCLAFLGIGIGIGPIPTFSIGIGIEPIPDWRSSIGFWRPKSKIFAEHEFWHAESKFLAEHEFGHAESKFFGEDDALQIGDDQTQEKQFKQKFIVLI